MESGCNGWISIVLLLYVFGIKYLNKCNSSTASTLVPNKYLLIMCYARVPRGEY